MRLSKDSPTIVGLSQDTAEVRKVLLDAIILIQ
jgi:hypothetical protein